MGGKGTSVEARLAQIARRSYGVVTRKQLLTASISSREIEHRIANGSLIRRYTGVYRVGHMASSVEADYLAAVRACGRDAVLCGRAAAWLHGLVKGKPPPPEVAVPSKRRVKGLWPRRSDVPRGHRTLVRGVPVTTVPRTLVDLAAVLTLDDLARAFHEAGVRYRTTPRQIDAVLNGRKIAKGAPNLRLVMGRETPVSLSRMESFFIASLRKQGHPLPETNRDVEGKRVDCRWPEYGVTAELLSFQFHNSRLSWEDDHARKRAARKRGDVFLTFTWHDVFVDQSYMWSELERVLPRRPARPR